MVEVTPLLVGCAAPYSGKMLHMKTNQRQSSSHRPMNPAIRCSLAAVALMLGACEQGEPPKGPSGTAGAATQAPPSLIERAMVFTKDATKTITEQATAAAVSAASQATGVTADQVRAVADSARSRSTALAEVTTAQAQQLIDQAKSFIAKERPDLAAGVMEKLRLVKAALPEGLGAEIDRLDAMLKGLAKQQPTASAAATPPASR